MEIMISASKSWATFPSSEDARVWTQLFPVLQDTWGYTLHPKLIIILSCADSFKGFWCAFPHIVPYSTLSKIVNLLPYSREDDTEIPAVLCMEITMGNPETHWAKQQSAKYGNLTWSPLCLAPVVLRTTSQLFKVQPRPRWLSLCASSSIFSASSLHSSHNELSWTPLYRHDISKHCISLHALFSLEQWNPYVTSSHFHLNNGHTLWST